MANDKNKFNRRAFIKTAGTASLASVFAGSTFAQSENPKNSKDKPVPSQQASANPQVPKRKLGKTGADIPILGLGGMFDIPNNQIVLRKAIDWGVTFWDTSNTYENGHSELGIGQFIKKNPGIRKKLFIVSKASGARNPQQIEEKLQLSLKRMNTDYIDLFYGIHGMRSASQLTDELRLWAENAKKRKLIRYFGFSTHTDMAGCMAGAAKKNWIDAIMPKYNFRDIQNKKTQAAVNACHKAGIALIAMKTQGGGPVKLKSELDKKMTGRFLKRGFTKHQVKLQAVWQDERFCSICSQMPNIKFLLSNVGAALDKTKLSQADFDYLDQFAQQTGSDYCAGCSSICSNATPEMPYISDVMRYLMYYNDYGQQARAKASFANLPSQVTNRLPHIDYSAAQRCCPQKLPIAKLMRQAAKQLA